MMDTFYGPLRPMAVQRQRFIAILALHGAALESGLRSPGAPPRIRMGGITGSGSYLG